MTAVAAVATLAVANVVQPRSSASADSYVEGDVIASDSFSRTEGSGFGDAETGGTYRSSATSGLSVNGATGSIAFPRSGVGRGAVLTSASVADVSAGITITTPTAPAGGGGYYATLQARASDSASYGAKLRVEPDGTASLRIVRTRDGVTRTLGGEAVIARDVTSGTPLRVDLQVTGADKVSLRARAYVADGSAPDWQLATTDASDKRLDAGGIGLWSYLSSATKPLSVDIDDLRAVKLTSAPASEPTKPTPTTPAPAPTKPVPAPAPAPAPTKPAPAPTPSTPSGDRGSAAVGSTSYSIPSGALFVSSSATSQGNGSRSAPFDSVERAIAEAPSGATLVLRGGTYHEFVTIPKGKRLTVQSYPGEAVWFDGSEKLTSWKKGSTGWVVDGWDYDFDTSPTFTQGAPDNTHESIKFIDPKFPLAAHPDQVWIDDVALTEVGSRSAVKDGTFYVDRKADQLVLGTNPSGRDVRASTLQMGLNVLGDGTVIRGIGVQRYATSVWQKSALFTQASDVLVENVVARENAASGIYASRGSGVTYRSLTLRDNGRSGGGAVYSDDFTLEKSIVDGNNVQRFKQLPGSGGFKITRARDVSVVDNDIRDNRTNGLWFDESVYNGTVTGNDISGNAVGLVLELSAKFVVADNRIHDNASLGLSVQNSGDLQIWNNTVIRNGGAPVTLVQDPRRQTNPSDAGHDPRQQQPDMTIPWLVKDITISNNILGGSTEGGLFHVVDQQKKLTAEQMNISANGNLYQNPNEGRYTVVRWANGGSGLSYYRSVEEFRNDTGQEKRSQFLQGADAVDGDFALTSAAKGLVSSISLPLPSRLSGILGGLGLPKIGASPTP